MGPVSNEIGRDAAESEPLENAPGAPSSETTSAQVLGLIYVDTRKRMRVRKALRGEKLA